MKHHKQQDARRQSADKKIKKKRSTTSKNTRHAKGKFIQEKYTRSYPRACNTYHITMQYTSYNDAYQDVGQKNYVPS